MGNSDTIFIGMGGGFGPLAQVLPIANELKKHDVRIVCHNYHAAAAMLQKMNFIYFGLPEEVKDPENINPNGPQWWNEDYLWSKYGYLDYDYVKLLVRVFSDVVIQYNPKVIIAVHFPAMAMVARKFGIPLVCISQACNLKQGKGGRTTWWKELPANLDRTSPVVNKVLLEMGLEPIGQMEDLNEGDLTIVPGIPEFDVVDDDRIFYTGPMFWEGPDELRHKDFQVKRRGRYLIHAYTGHLFNSEGRPTGIILLKNIVEAFNHSEFDLVISTGTGQRVPADLEVAGNIQIVDWVPVNQVIPQCDLIIHHGGHGSCLQGLAHGVPAIALPTTDEREYNGRQLAGLGVGAYLTPEVLTPESLLTTAKAMVENQLMNASARSLAETIQQRNYQGASEAAQLILELMNQPNTAQNMCLDR